MLFYERRLPEHLQRRHSELLATPTPSPLNEDKPETEEQPKVETDNNINKEPAAAEDAEPVQAEAEKSTPLSTETEKLEEKEQTDKPDPTQISEDKEMEKGTANCDNIKSNNNHEPQASTSKAVVVAEAKASTKQQQFRPLLSKELEDWIWQDNRQFLQDRNIFEHTYFK